MIQRKKVVLLRPTVGIGDGAVLSDLAMPFTAEGIDEAGGAGSTSETQSENTNVSCAKR